MVLVKMNKPLHVVTPLIPSSALSTLAGRDVFLKLENVQPSGSFKIRGIGRTMQEAVKNGAKEFVGSSGGNAGMAMAVAAKQMEKKLTIFIPTSTLPFMIEKLKAEGAIVVVAGSNWNEANQAATAANESPDTFMVHPFNQPSTWAGHSTLIAELAEQLDTIPACVVTCVGGGGLAMGLLQGMDQLDTWEKVPLITMETEGANCLLAARQAGQLVTLPAITSIATSLGALAVAEDLLTYCLDKPSKVISHQVTDLDAKRSCVKFATDQRLLVEPACGAALSAVYTGLIKQLLDNLGEGPVVMVVCGGNIVNVDLIEKWKQEVFSK